MRFVVSVGICLALAAPASAQWPAAAEPFRDLWEMEWQRCGLRDLYEPWMLGQVYQESRFNANAISPVGAEGLTQVIPATDRALARQNSEYAALAGGPDEPRVALRALCLLTLEGLRAMRGAPDRKVRWRFASYIYNGGYWIRFEQRAAAADGHDPWDWEIVFEQYCGKVKLPNGRGPRAAASCRENMEYPEYAFRYASLFER